MTNQITPRHLSLAMRFTGWRLGIAPGVYGERADPIVMMYLFNAGIVRPTKNHRLRTELVVEHANRWCHRIYGSDYVHGFSSGYWNSTRAFPLTQDFVIGLRDGRMALNRFNMERVMEAA